jgi:hypothetical protein
MSRAFVPLFPEAVAVDPAGAPVPCWVEYAFQGEAVDPDADVVIRLAGACLSVFELVHLLHYCEQDRFSYTTHSVQARTDHFA